MVYILVIVDVVVLGFYVPPTAKVKAERNLGFKKPAIKLTTLC